MSKRRYQAAPLLPFRLNNIEDFVVGSHPIIHPNLPKYKKYWDEQSSRCVEGLWGHDYDKKSNEGGYRFMPGNLYFYINMTPIKKEGLYGKEITGNPNLRDIEWKIFYGLTACDGFSGFKEDKINSCFLPIQKVERGIELDDIDKLMLEQYADEVRNPYTGELKKYIDPREYIYSTFKEPLGQPLYANQAQNMILLSTRRLGKSYIMGNGVIGYDFTFNGARTFSDYIDKSTSSTIVVGSHKSKDSLELLSKFVDTHDHLRTKVGSFGIESEDPQNGCYWTPFDGSLQSGKFITNKIKIKGGKASKGVGSRVAHVSYKDNPNAGVGYAARRMVVEEAGLLDNFEDVHKENSATQERETKFGYSIYIGTGGNIEKIKEIREAFYNPRGYQVLPYKDNWNKSNKDIGLFIPAYYRKKIYKDDHGNTDYEKAFNDLMKERERLKNQSSKAYEGNVISFPIVPQEMFLQSSGNKFPTAEIQDRITELETGEWKKKAQVGKLYYIDRDKRRVVWELDVDKRLKPIVRWGDEDGRSDEELEGAFVIYEHPEDPPEPTFDSPLYIGFYDPVRDEDGGSSLAACFIFKVWDFDNRHKMQYNIVAEWIGRHNSLEECHERALKLCTYYNAKLLPEIVNRDIVRHCNMTGRYDMLQPKPGLAIEGIIKQKKTYEVGVYISPQMKPKLETYAAELVQAVVDKKQRIESNKLITTVEKMVDGCYSLRALEEMMYYTRDENFDYISCLFLLGLWSRQQELEPYIENEEKEDSEDTFLSLIDRASKPKFNSAFEY